MEHDVKQLLKETKELIKKKEYNSALDVCKSILKQDKNNYFAFVLTGVSFQELGQPDKALSAFTKATELQPDQLTAWQGLAAFLEQERSRSVISTDDGQQLRELSEKLKSVYEKLEKLFSSDPIKKDSILKKKCELLGSLGQLEKCVDVAKLLLEKKDKEATKIVTKILSPYLAQLDNATLILLEDSLNRIVSSCDEKDEDNFYKGHYLPIALQTGHYGKAYKTACDVLQSDSENIKALEAVCFVFGKDATVGLQIPLEKVDVAITTLLAVNPANKHALLAKARWLVLKERVSEAKQLLDRLNTKENSSSCGPLLCQVYRHLHQWTNLEKISRTALNISDSPNWRRELIKSLLEQGGEERLREASELLQKDDQTSPSTKLLQILYFIRSNQTGKCPELLNALETETDANVNAQFMILKAEYLDKTNRCEEAIQLLDRARKDYNQDVNVLLGAARILWKKPEQRAESVNLLLNVIKINKDIAEPFIFLGFFYASEQQCQNLSYLQRAIRCLEKAFQLDPHQKRTSERLLELYLVCQDSASAVKLLEVVIQMNPRDCRWAWLQKGYLHLKMYHGGKDKMKSLEKEKEASQAVTSLQNALGIDSDDSTAWEALGDAYIARGSYTAALKAFEKAVELNKASTYSAYQIAKLKHIMGEYSEAVMAFEALLNDNAGYVPALKGKGETFLSQMNDYLTEGFTGRVMDCFSSALDLLVRAAQLQPQLACIWSLMGHLCLTVRSLAENDFVGITLPHQLEIDSSTVTKQTVMELGTKFFLSALKLLPDSASLWHNLALSYEAYNQTSHATEATKKAITLEPDDPSHWDLLGLIVQTQQPAVSQHAFIRALELNAKSPRAAATWTHLGALYLKHGDLRLAHECFKQSQNVDPSHVAAWIGQANIAEHLSPSEAMDLFRHTVAIGSGCAGQCEGSPSYAQWVITTLADPSLKKTSHYRYSIVQMHAVPAAIDGLVRYVALYPQDSCSLNLLGLLYERQGLLSKAEEAFLQGIECLDRDNPTVANAARIDKMKANLARVYTMLDRCEEATQLYGTLQESELSSACGIALTHFKAKRYAEAYLTYEAALNWLASDEEKRSHLLVAMAMTAYRRDFPDADVGKNHLYESSLLQPPSVYGLLALAALGLLTEDETLTMAAFQELLPYQSESRYVTDISRLLAYQHWSTGSQMQGRREIARNIHMLPNEAELWTLMAQYQASLATQEDSNQGLLVARCAEIAFHARRNEQQSFDEQHIFRPSELSQVISLISLGYLLSGMSTNSLIAAQKAVHCNPHSAASWSVLLSASAQAHPQQRLGWLKKMIEHLRRRCDVTKFSRLGPWLSNYERRLVTMLQSR